LGSEDVGGFTQGKKNTTSLKVETGVRNQLVDDGEGTRLKAGFLSKDLVVHVQVRGLGLQSFGFARFARFKRESSGQADSG
jgi:hypothetical protein